MHVPFTKGFTIEVQKPSKYTPKRMSYKVVLRCSYPELLKVKAVASFHSAHDEEKVRSEDKRHTFPTHTKEVLCVTEDVAKVDVKEVSWGK